ncbi:uncharacterized protein LOC131879920 [Tigriopus californicus]|uniref:uncharacterized protein LOC131879920 n=1 Tax=Tigriopus californicus TaxID=6832 RepID=UPI0027DA3E9C|nr:uncharacterized protein LOC131879920 [Tigriopus californicus]
MAPSVDEVEKNSFEIEWLETCRQKVVLPNSKCEDFCIQVNERLRKRIRGEFDNEIKQQAMFQLLGKDYVRVNFPRQKFKPQLLDPPKTKPDLKEMYLKEMRELLEENALKSIKDLDYPKELGDYEGEDPLGEFANEIRLVFKESLEQQIQEQSESAKKEEIEEDVEEANNDQEKRVKNEDKITRGEIGNEITGGALMSLMSQVREFDAKEAYVEPFRSQNIMLPGKLREMFWIDSIYYGEFKAVDDQKDKKRGRDKGKKTKGEQLKIGEIRKQFRSDVNKKMNLGNLQRAVQSSDYKKIYSVIIDSYHTTKVVQPFAEDEFMLQNAHVLNVCNVLNKTYSNSHIFLLHALHVAFPRKDDEKEEKTICRLASDLHLLIQKCVPRWSEVFRIADDVLRTLTKEDDEYAKHLQRALEKQVRQVDVYDFAYEILHEDTKKSVKIWNDLYKKKKDSKNKDWNLFADVAVYLRKWISEAFAGILSQNNLFYVWDLLFLNRWSRDIFKKITLAILILIKPWAMRADNHKRLSKVLLEEPGKIFIGDLKEAMSILSKDLPINQIMNNNIVLVAQSEAQPQDNGLEKGEEEETLGEDQEPEGEKVEAVEEIEDGEQGSPVEEPDISKDDGNEETPEEIEEGATTEEPSSVGEDLPFDEVEEPPEEPADEVPSEKPPEEKKKAKKPKPLTMAEYMKKKRVPGSAASTSKLASAVDTATDALTEDNN